MKKILLSLSFRQYERLKEASENSIQLPMSEIIRRAIDEYLDKKAKINNNQGGNNG